MSLGGAQIMVTKSDSNYKKRMHIKYSQTIKKR